MNASVPADRVRTRGEYRVEREPRSSEPVRLLNAAIAAAKEQAERLQREYAASGRRALERN
jgi:hypothetical protein